jgi:DNA-binding transcriptional LysR family regulator
MPETDSYGGRVKLRHLKIIIAVAQSGSMAKAAESLAISHPVISKAIAELEQTLGVRLFDRGSQGVEPTIYGQALLQCGVAVFDELRQGLKQVDFLADPAVGQLRVGSSEPMAAGILPAITERLLRQHPGVVLHAIHADTATLEYRELRERNVELLLGRIRIPFAEEDLTAETLFDEQMLVAAGTTSPWARRRRIELGELVKEPWILAPPDSLPGQLYEETFHASGLAAPRASVVTLSIHLCSTMVAAGRFITLLPSSLLRLAAERLSLKILPVDLPSLPRPVGIVTVKNRTLSPFAERFIECAREVAKSLAALGRRPRADAD